MQTKKLLVMCLMGILFVGMGLPRALDAFQDKPSKSEKEKGGTKAIESNPTGAKAAPGGVTFTNGQVCTVYRGGLWRDTFTVPDNFSIQGCKDLVKYILGADGSYQLGCASATGIAFSTENSTQWGCGWR